MSPGDEIHLWVIYMPTQSDYPGQFVLRRQRVVFPERDEDVPEVRADAIALVCATMEQARLAVPRGCTCIGRHPNDDPAIAEVWL